MCYVHVGSDTIRPFIMKDARAHRHIDMLRFNITYTCLHEYLVNIGGASQTGKDPFWKYLKYI